MTLIEKMIETLSSIRCVSVETIIQELRDNNESTHNDLFKLASAWKACE